MMESILVEKSAEDVMSSSILVEAKMTKPRQKEGTGE